MAAVHALEELWGGGRWPNKTLDDAAKLVLAKHILETKERLPLSQAGGLLRAALGTRWITAKERVAKGLPSLAEVLQSDPYFQLTGSPGFNHSAGLSLARIGELVQVMLGNSAGGGPATLNPRLATHPSRPGRPPCHPSRPGRPPCPRFSAHGQCMFGAKCLYDHTKTAGDSTMPASHSAAVTTPQQAGGPSMPAVAQDEDFQYPQNPHMPECTPYVMVGYCQQGDACRFHHPPLTAQQRAVHAARTQERIKWDKNKPGAVKIGPHGLPLRPNANECPHYTKYGACGFGVVCMFDHPINDAQSNTAQPSHPPTKAPTPPQPKQPVRQPPKTLLLGLMVDGIWPPGASKEDFLKGALAKHLIGLVDQGGAQGVSVLEKDGQTVYQILMAQAGAYLRAQWQEQRLYNFEQKPYTSLAELFKDEELFAVTTQGPKATPCIQLRYTALSEDGVPDATVAVFAAADAVWQQDKGPEQWLRNALAKHIFAVHFTPERVAEVFSLPETKHTVFCVHMAQAGEHLRKAWQLEDHPYKSLPYPSLKDVTAHQGLLPVETSKHNGTQLHIVLDLERLIQEAPRAAERRRQRAAAKAAQAAAAQAGRSPAAGGAHGRQRQQQEEEEQLDGDSSSSSQHDMGSDGSDNHGAPAGELSGLEQSMADIYEEAVARLIESHPGNEGFLSALTEQYDARHAEDDRSADAAESNSSAGTSSTGGVPEHVAAVAGLPAVQQWWPSSQPVHKDWSWAEACVCVVTPESSAATLMVQHLELCDVIGVACSSLNEQIHMVQFFAPHVSVAGMVLPATAYLLDVKNHQAASGLMALIKPILETCNVVKVCHGSCIWFRHLKHAFGISLWGHVDTQAAHAAICAMRAAATGAPTGNTTLSLAVLLKNHGFWHPLRSEVKTVNKRKANPVYHSNQSVWHGLAQRPMSDDMSTCAAADVALTIPLMESLVPDLQAAATQLLRSRRTHAIWAAPSLASLGGAKGTRLIPAVLQQLAEANDSVLALWRKWGLLGALHVGPDGWDPAITSQTAW